VVSGIPEPSTLTLFQQLCWGYNNMNWTASCGATYYELYGSTSVNFATQFLEYSGPNLSRSVNVSQTTYYRVRACNASGCSGYHAAQQPAIYYNRCWF
jgi:hypothetical protein